MTAPSSDLRIPRRAAAAILAVTAAAYIAAALYAVFNGRIWLDETSYILKSWGYVTGAAHPYTDADATWYMPFYFYQLGWAQKLFGAGHITGRLMSVAFGAASGGLVFAICRKLNISSMISALAVAIYLLTPTTIYYFASATPIATVAFLMLLAIYLIIVSRGNPRGMMSVALGLLSCVLFFYRQNMILALIVLWPAYVWLIGRDRGRQAALLALSVGLGTVAVLALFPHKLAFYAIRLPLLTPVLEKFALLPRTYALIDTATESRYSLGLAGAWSWRDPVNGFLLPYLGTVMLAFGLCFTRGALRLVAVFFFFLAVTHYLGSAGYCSACILTYANYFIAVGVIAAALLLDFLWRREKIGRLRLAALALGVILLNAAGTTFAAPGRDGTPSPYRTFPLPMVARYNGASDLTVAARFAQIVAATLPAESHVLVIHNLTSLAYAAASAGKTMPTPVLNLRQSYRALRAGLSDEQRIDTVRALETRILLDG